MYQHLMCLPWCFLVTHEVSNDINNAEASWVGFQIWLLKSSVSAFCERRMRKLVLSSQYHGQGFVWSDQLLIRYEVLSLARTTAKTSPVNAF